MSDKDTKCMIHRGADNSAPYPVSRMAPAIELVDLAKEIAQADAALGHQLTGKLKVIATQMQQLQQQARAILEKAAADQRLHHAQCNFKRLPGKIYHLYEKPDKTLYLSMLSPADWNNQPPHTYEGAFRLEADMSWTPAEQLEQAENAQKVVEKLIMLREDA